MPFILERLKIGMNLEGAESSSEGLVLIACDLLIAKEQYLVLDERIAELCKRGVSRLSDVDSADLGTQSSRDRTDRHCFQDLIDVSIGNAYQMSLDSATRFFPGRRAICGCGRAAPR
jgi:hypothetical protein